MPTMWREDEHLEQGYSQSPSVPAQSAPAPDEFLTLAASSYEDSSSYWEANFYKTWQHSLSNFRSRHPQGSKYHTDGYRSRSSVFRPKTRAAVRRSEAAADQAFFSTDDAVVVSPENEKNPLNVVAAEIRKELLNYRMSCPDKRYGIDWYMTLIGAYQDTKVMGAVCSYQDWEFEERTVTVEKDAIDPATGRPVFDGQTGEQYVDEVQERRVVKDKPTVRLVPLENIRFHPAASWVDPVNTSPYFIELMPYYIYEVKEKMKSGEWFTYQNIDFSRARRDIYDTVRQERDGRERRDPYEDMKQTGDFGIVWVHKNIIKYGGQDLVFHTLGTYLRLDDPIPIEQAFPAQQGVRPYVVGTCMVETHRVMPSSPVELARGLQGMANEIVNSRFDNVRLVLNRRHYVNRDANVDVRALKVSVPGGIVAMDDVNNDVTPEDIPDVTSSGYAEQDRVNVDMDDIMGTFSSGSVQSNRQLNETVGGMNLMNQDSNSLQEHELKVFSHTWVEPVVHQIDQLNMYFESDQRVLTLVGEKSKAFRRMRQEFKKQYGQEPTVDIERIAAAGVDVKVDVGFGATNPQGRIEKMMMGLNVIASVIPGKLQKAKEDAIANEVMGILGFQSAERFFYSDDEEDDPRVQKLQQMVQQLQQEIEMEMHKAKAKAEADLRIAQFEAQSNERLQGMKEQAEHRLKMLEMASDRFNQQLQGKVSVGDLSIKRGQLALERDRFRMEGQRGDEDLEFRMSEEVRNERAADREDRIVDRADRAAERDEQSAAATKKTEKMAKDASDLADDLSEQIKSIDQAIKALTDNGTKDADKLGQQLDDIADEVSTVAEELESRAEADEQNEKRRKDIRDYLMKNGTPETKAMMERLNAD